MKSFKAKIPMWSLCYLINGDVDTLTDDEIRMADEFVEENNVSRIWPINDKCERLGYYFSPFPAFGLASDVVDCNVYCH